MNIGRDLCVTRQNDGKEALSLRRFFGVDWTARMLFCRCQSRIPFESNTVWAPCFIPSAVGEQIR